MCWFRKHAILFLTACCCSAAVLAEPGDFVIGGGIEADSEDGVSLSMLGDVGIGQDTWLSVGLAHSDVDVPRQGELDTWYADLGLDHFFEPVGVRVGVAYWGNSDLLESTDVRGSVYTRGDGGMLSVDAEHREFDFNFLATDFLPRFNVGFDANGLGLSGRIAASENVNLRAVGMRYEYSRDFETENTDRVVAVLTNSRLSVLSSLVDWRAGLGVGIDMGLRHWQLDLNKWRGAVDNSDNIGATLSFLSPLSQRTDIEFSLGYDDSDLYGAVTVLSVFLYFYGGH
jgi:hypothetical protein